MARADLLCELIKYGLNNDKISFRKAAEALCADERGKQHAVLANKIEELLNQSINQFQRKRFLHRHLYEAVLMNKVYIQKLFLIKG